MSCLLCEHFNRGCGTGRFCMLWLFCVFVHMRVCCSEISVSSYNKEVHECQASGMAASRALKTQQDTVYISISFWVGPIVRCTGLEDFLKLMMHMLVIFLLPFAVSRSNLFFSLKTFGSGTSQKEFLHCPFVARLCVWIVIHLFCCYSMDLEICRTPFSLAISGLCVAFTLWHCC